MIYIGMGSNLGDRAANMERGTAWLEAIPGVAVCAVSAAYETEPVGGPPGQPKFLNAVAALTCRLEPAALLAALKRIERRMGRDPNAVRWGPRIIDLDILLFHERTVNATDLIIPHPRLAQRRFVLEPLCDIAPDLRHPVLHCTIKDLLAKVVQGA